MNRRLLSTTLSLSTLAVVFAAAPTLHASPALSAAPTRALSAVLVTALDADSAYNDGITAYQAGNFDAAITAFTAAVKLRPRFGDAYFNRGLSYEAKRDWKSAIADFTKVFETKPNLADGYVERGRSYANNGNFDAAQADFTKALSLKPKNSDAFLARGDAYFAQKKYDNAVNDYTQYLALLPTPDPGVYNNRGLANYARGNYDMAIADFTAYAKADPKGSQDSYAFLGDAYLQKKEYPQAIAAYTKFAGTHPNDTSVLKSRGLAYLQAKQYAESLKDYQAFLVGHPNDSEALINSTIDKKALNVDTTADLLRVITSDGTNVPARAELAGNYIAKKNYAGAIEQYNAILGMKPGEMQYVYNRGVAYSLSGDNAKATADMQRYTKANPTDPLGFDALGVDLGNAKDWTGSVAAFTQLLALKPNDPDALKNRGIANYNAAKYEVAGADLTRYDELKPNDAAVSNLLSDIALRTGKTSVAITRLKAQLAKNPSDAPAWFNLGGAYYKAKETQNAIDAFTKALALKPSDEVTLFNRGLAYYDLGKAGNSAGYTKAVADASSALALKPAFPDAILLKADAEYGSKSWKAAETDYARYVSTGGTPENKTYAQSQELGAGIEAKDYANVQTLVGELIRQNPNEPSNYRIRGLAAYAQGNYDAAIPDLAKYTQMKPDDAEGFYNLGISYAGKKDSMNAATNFEKASDLKVGYYQAAYQAAVSYKALADASSADAPKQASLYDKAIAAYDKAANSSGAKGKEAGDALYNEASAMEAKAKAADNVDALKTAVPVWQRYIVASPTDPELPKIKLHIEALKAQIAREGQ